jgi:phasin family protein
MPIDNPYAGSDTAFTGAMSQAKNAAEEFARMFSELKMPAIPDAEAVLTAHRRNFEALSAANRIALEGAQTVAKRHMEIMQQTMAELSDSLRSLSSAEAPSAKAARQTELLKRAYERTVSNTKELSDLIQRSNGEALGLLNKRFAEAMDEVKQLMAKSAHKV